MLCQKNMFQCILTPFDSAFTHLLGLILIRNKLQCIWSLFHNSFWHFLCLVLYLPRTNSIGHESFSTALLHIFHPVNTGRKLNLHKTFRRRPGSLLNVLCMFNLCPVSTGRNFKVIKGKFQRVWFFTYCFVAYLLGVKATREKFQFFRLFLYSSFIYLLLFKVNRDKF